MGHAGVALDSVGPEQEDLWDHRGAFQAATRSPPGAMSIPKCFFMAASRLQQIAHILQVPVAFFFEGAPNASAPRGSHERALSIAQIDDFVSDSNGLRLIGAFMRIDNADLRRKIVMLVQEIAGDDGN